MTMPIFSKVFLGLLLFSAAILTSFAAEQEPFTAGRYLTASAKPTSEQQDLLNQSFQVKFPRSVKTIEDAINHLLRFSGYKLVNRQSLPVHAQAILAQSLPEAHRTLGLMSLKDGLLTLVSEPFDLLVDPIHRLLSFRLHASYIHLYQSL